MPNPAVRSWFDGNISYILFPIYSVSSEGFCENDADADLPSDSRAINNEQDDADSQEGGGSDSASSSDVGASCRVKMIFDF